MVLLSFMAIIALSGVVFTAYVSSRIRLLRALHSCSPQQTHTCLREGGGYFRGSILWSTQVEAILI